MAQYTAEAFRWSGTYYNADYNTSYNATFDDNDDSYNGRGDGNESISINDGAFGGTTGTPYAIDVSFSDTGGDSHVETFYFFNTGGSWYFLPGPGSAFSVGAHLGSYQSHTSGWDYTDVICFTPGALIATPLGTRLVEDLKIGDLVITRDHGLQAIRWIGRKIITGARLYANPHLRPITIRKGAFGPDLPTHDLTVSPQHRMLASGPQAELQFDTKEVLVPAKDMKNDHTVQIDHKTTRTEYIHILFDKHELITANGTLTESFHPGAMGINAIGEASRAELFEIFPELQINPQSFGPSARRVLKPHESLLFIPRSQPHPHSQERLSPKFATS